MTYTRVRDYRSTKALWSEVLQFTFYVTIAYQGWLTILGSSFDNEVSVNYMYINLVCKCADVNLTRINGIICKL